MENEGLYHPLRNGDASTSDDSRLNQLGYKQELRRSLSAISNFSVTFSIVSVLTGLSTTYSVGLTYGGPLTMVYGWPIVGAMTLVVGMSMAEICSAYPTSGGLYFWSAKLSGQRWGPFASWLTGWNILPSVDILVAAVDYVLSNEQVVYDPSRELHKQQSHGEVSPDVLLPKWEFSELRGIL